MSEGAYAERFTEPYGVGAGYQEVVAVANPAAGANAVFSNDSRYISVVVSLAFKLVTDGNAGNRFLSLQYEDGNGGIFAIAGVSAAQAASTTELYSLFVNAGQQFSSAGLFNIGALPDVYLAPGHLLRIVVNGVKAGDQLSVIQLAVDRYSSAHHAVRRQRRRPLG